MKQRGQSPLGAAVQRAHHWEAATVRLFGRGALGSLYNIRAPPKSKEAGFVSLSDEAGVEIKRNVALFHSVRKFT